MIAGRLIIAAWFVASLAVPAGAAEDPQSPAGGDQAPASAGDASDHVIVAPENARTASNGGPGVELITGGSSKDGAARVGRLPVID